MRRASIATLALLLSVLLLDASAAGQPLIGAGARVFQQGAVPNPAAPSGADTGADLERALDELDSLRARRERADAEIGALVGQHAGARQRLRRRVRTLRRLRRAGALPLSEGFDALLRHQSRVHRVERQVSRDARAFQTVSRRVRALRADAGRVAEALATQEREVASLRVQRASQRSQLALLSEMIEDPAAWSGPSLSGFGIRLSDPPARGFRLADERGSLPLPVAGSAELRDAEREGGAGLELTTAIGVTVRAVGPGTVSFASPHPAYGQLVIIDHHDGHYTVYGGLGATAVRSGAMVQRDSVLGAVGPQPIFFQVRRGTRPLPARQWLGI